MKVEIGEIYNLYKPTGIINCRSANHLFKVQVMDQRPFGFLHYYICRRVDNCAMVLALTDELSEVKQ